MKLPTKEEINVYNSLDEITACNHYYNKTLEEVEILFREYLDYCDDLMWMGPIAFNFYLQAAINYLQSDYSTGDSDMINCLASVVKYRWKQKEFLLVIDRVNEIITYVINNYSKFEVSPTIYGDLLEKYKTLQAQLKEINGEGSQ